MSLFNWTIRERDVAYCIIEMLSERDSSEQDFTASDIYDIYGDRLEKLWGDLPVSLTPIFRSLKSNHRELIQPNGDYYPYRLARGGYLAMLLSLRMRHKM